MKKVRKALSLLLIFVLLIGKFPSDVIRADELSDTVAAYRAQLEKTSYPLGDEPGCYSKTAYDAYLDAIAYAEELSNRGTATTEEAGVAIAAIEKAEHALNDSIVMTKKGTTYNAYRDFENDAVGLYPYGIVTEALTNGAKAVIEEENGNKFFRLTTTGTSGKANMYIPYAKSASATGDQRIVVEFSMRFNEKLQYTNSYIAKNQNNDSATTIAFDNANKQHKVVLKKSANSSIKPADFEYDKWHDFVAVHNMETQTYTVYMDGEMIAEDYPFRTTGTTSLIGHVFGVDNFSNAKVDFDDIVVRVVEKESEIRIEKTTASITGVIPANMESDGSLIETGSDRYTFMVNAPVDEKISLSSTGIKVTDSSGKSVAATVMNNLYYSMQTGNNGKYTVKTKIDYLKVLHNGNQYVVMAYDENDNLLEGGNIFLVSENMEEEKMATIALDAISITTKENAITKADIVSSNKFTYMCNGKINQVFSLKEITGFEEFYYGDDLNSITKCTHAMIQKSGEEYVLVPVNAEGKPVDTNVYMVFDHLYTFDITLNSIVNEHSEDNGDVYLWKGSEYYVTENLNPAEGDTLRTIDKELTEVKPYTVTVTGRMGDSFVASEVGELLIYTAIGADKIFIKDWINLRKYPSDNGERYFNGYCINDYIKLNSFEDKVNYFSIYEKTDGTVALGAMMPGDLMYPIEDIDFYTLRGAVVKPTVMHAKNIYHVQLRVPSNAVIEKDGELYSGDLTLSGGSAVVIYNGQELVNKAFSNVSSSGGQQETSSSEWAKNIVYGYNSSNVIYEPAFDPAVMQVTVTFKVYGTLTSSTGKKIVYSREEPLTVTEELSHEKMLQSFYACPNLRGYDVLLDLSAAVKKKEEEGAHKISVTKLWDDSSNYYGVRPDEVTVTLERSLDGINWKEFNNNVITISGEDENKGKSSWTKELTNIETYTVENGEIVPYSFRIKEEKLVDTGNKEFTYESVIEGTTVTNKLNFEMESEVVVEKQWINNKGTVITDNLPKSISVRLYQDGKYYCTTYLSSKNNWKEIISGLPVYRTAQDKYVYTMCEIDDTEEKIESGQVAMFSDEHYEYKVNITNVSSATKEMKLTNTLLDIRTVTISNNIKKTFIETYDFSDDSVEFSYTVSVKYGDTYADAKSYGEGVKPTKDIGRYTFVLANGESAKIQVPDTYTVIVEEGPEHSDYYTTWSMNFNEATVGRVCMAESIQNDIIIDFVNNTTYYGDVEVQGFQMNTDYSEGAVSEKSPSFRVVSRACEKLKNANGELEDVVAYGTIYALDSEVNQDYGNNMKLDKAVLASSDYVYSEDEYNQIFYYECRVGKYMNWTAREVEDPYYNYYGLTFVMKSYEYSTLKADMTFRAYAKLSDGSIVYGTKIYSTNMYDIAENLYQNRKIGRKEGHDFLYRNVLNLVKMEENRVDICYSMLNALKVMSTGDIRYTYINNISKDIVDYVYCQGEYNYADRQVTDKEFSPKRLTLEQKEGLLNELNSVRSTDYNSLFEWIYNETENYKNYKGFYKRVSYDWGDSIYKDANTVKK